VMRLNLVVEGQTEEAFVRDLLRPHLLGFGVAATARCVRTGRKRGRDFRGGVVNYAKVRRDLTLWMREDQGPEAYFATFIDLYRLPRDFPGYEATETAGDVHGRVSRIEKAFEADIAHHLGQFMPHIQPYEFEALLFARPAAFTLRFPDRAQRVATLTHTAAEFASPEHIDDDEPPSKRILSTFADYDKTADGPILAAEIGLCAMRDSCAHFGRWLARLEAIAQPS